MHLFTVKPHDVFEFMLVCSLIKQDLTCKFDFKLEFFHVFRHGEVIVSLVSRLCFTQRYHLPIPFLSYDTDSDIHTCQYQLTFSFYKNQFF